MPGDDDAREAYLRRVTVGERRPHDAPVTLVPSDPAWPDAYNVIASRVLGALGTRVLGLEHVGSTAVPGLPAKPVIDVVLTVADTRDEPAWLPDLEAAGFVLRIREPAWHEHRLLKSPDPVGNLHVFPAGCAEVARMVRFRDRLRRDATDRERYAQAKQSLAARTWHHVQDYADAKGTVVEEILARDADARGASRPS